MTTMDEQATLAAAAGATSISPVGPASPPRLVLDGVSKRWGRNDPPLLHELDLELPPGTLALIAGRNGVGKTTLLRIVANIIAADRGTIRLDGSSPASNRREYQRRIGFLSAGSTGVYARVSVAQHLDFWARLALVPAAERSARVSAVLTRFDLEEIAARRTDRLSMGQRQRLRLAMAFLHGPSLVVLDEPWNSLDDKGFALVNRELKQFADGGGSGVLCVPAGHDLDLVPADRVYVLDGGKLELR
jgi:ABC-2 type transport system ATP-binding protein